MSWTDMWKGVPAYNYGICQWLAAGQWFSFGTHVSGLNKFLDHHDITQLELELREWVSDCCLAPT